MVRTEIGEEVSLCHFALCPEANQDFHNVVGVE